MLGDKKSPCESGFFGYFARGKVGARALFSTFVDLTPRTTLRRFLVDLFLDSAFSLDQARMAVLKGTRPVPLSCCNNVNTNWRGRVAFTLGADADFYRFVGRNNDWSVCGDWSAFDGGARTVPIDLALQESREGKNARPLVTPIPHDVVPPLQHRAHLLQPHRTAVCSLQSDELRARQ